MHKRRSATTSATSAQPTTPLRLASVRPRPARAAIAARPSELVKNEDLAIRRHAEYARIASRIAPALMQQVFDFTERLAKGEIPPFLLCGG